MRLVDGNNMLHREAENIGRGIHPVRFMFSRWASPPETTIIVWDGPYANKRRQEIYAPYKMNRRPKEESKYRFFEIVKGVLKFTPVIQIECPGWEADDIIGTLVDKYHATNSITVETNDGDYWQHSNKCYLPLVSKKWKGMTPGECLLYKSLVGDTKDGIPGVKAFGFKSWELFTPETRAQLIEAVEEEDYLLFSQTKGWPPRIKINKELFKQVCLFYRLNKYWEVPDSQMIDGMFAGKLNIAAAEHFMEKFLV